MLYSESENANIDVKLQDAYAHLHGTDNGNPYFFSYSIFSKLPKISLKSFSEEENDILNKLIREVLYHSKLHNHCKEVQITYDNSKILKDTTDYVAVYGNEKEVSFFTNKATRELVESAKGLVVVTLHNHTDITDLYLKDMIVFAGVPTIKMMAEVNTNGQVSVFGRTKECDLLPVFIKCYESVIGNEQSFSIEALDLLNAKERMAIKENFVKEAQKYGAKYFPLITKDRNVYENVDRNEKSGEEIDL